MGRGGGRGGSLAGGGARARDSEGRWSRDGQPPPLQAGCRVTSPPCLQGVALPFSFPQGCSSASGTLRGLSSRPRLSGGLAATGFERPARGAKAGARRPLDSPHCAFSGRGQCRVPAPCGSQLHQGGEDSVRSRQSLATSWILSPDFEVRGTRVSLARLALWAPGG